jgi:hypothetical protein
LPLIINQQFEPTSVSTLVADKSADASFAKSYQLFTTTPVVEQTFGVKSAIPSSLSDSVMDALKRINNQQLQLVNEISTYLQNPAKETADQSLSTISSLVSSILDTAASAITENAALVANEHSQELAKALPEIYSAAVASASVAVSSFPPKAAADHNPTPPSTRRSIVPSPAASSRSGQSSARSSVSVLKSRSQDVEDSVAIVNASPTIAPVISIIESLEVRCEHLVLRRGRPGGLSILELGLQIVEFQDPRLNADDPRLTIL